MQNQRQTQGKTLEKRPFTSIKRPDTIGLTWYQRAYVLISGAAVSMQKYWQRQVPGA